jgi:hypothetical protein
LSRLKNAESGKNCQNFQNFIVNFFTELILSLHILKGVDCFKGLAYETFQTSILEADFCFCFGMNNF